MFRRCIKGVSWLTGKDQGQKHKPINNRDDPNPVKIDSPHRGYTHGSSNKMSSSASYEQDLAIGYTNFTVSIDKNEITIAGGDRIYQVLDDDIKRMECLKSGLRGQGGFTVSTESSDDNNLTIKLGHMLLPEPYVIVVPRVIDEISDHIILDRRVTALEKRAHESFVPITKAALGPSIVTHEHASMSLEYVQAAIDKALNMEKSADNNEGVTVDQVPCNTVYELDLYYEFKNKFSLEKIKPSNNQLVFNRLFTYSNYEITIPENQTKYDYTILTRRVPYDTVGVMHLCPEWASEGVTIHLHTGLANGERATGMRDYMTSAWLFSVDPNILSNGYYTNKFDDYKDCFIVQDQKLFFVDRAALSKGLIPSCSDRKFRLHGAMAS